MSGLLPRCPRPGAKYRLRDPRTDVFLLISTRWVRVRALQIADRFRRRDNTLPEREGRPLAVGESPPAQG